MGGEGTTPLQVGEMCVAAVQESKGKKLGWRRIVQLRRKRLCKPSTPACTASGGVVGESKKTRNARNEGERREKTKARGACSGGVNTWEKSYCFEGVGEPRNATRRGKDCAQGET